MYASTDVSFYGRGAKLRSSTGLVHNTSLNNSNIDIRDYAAGRQQTLILVFFSISPPKNPRSTVFAHHSPNTKHPLFVYEQISIFVIQSFRNMRILSRNIKQKVKTFYSPLITKLPVLTNFDWNQRPEAYMGQWKTHLNGSNTHFTIKNPTFPSD